MQDLIKQKLAELKKLCKEFKVQSLYVFGSAAKSNFKDDSDIDFLLTFSEDLSVEEYTDNYFELHYKLRELFNREIDILTQRSLSNPYLIDSINETKQLIYEA